MAKYISTKTYNHLGPVAYRQWRADSHCNLIHGYALSFHFEFESDNLDSRNWVMDFGGLRPLKDLLEDWFDHTLLVADDDPDREHLVKLGDLGLAKITQVEKTGCEGLASFLYEYITNFSYDCICNAFALLLRIFSTYYQCSRYTVTIHISR